MTLDINLLREAVTVLSFAGFMGIVAYAVNPNNRKRFEEAARMPLDEEEPALAAGPSPQPSPKGEGADVGQVFANGGTVR